MIKLLRKAHHGAQAVPGLRWLDSTAVRLWFWLVGLIYRAILVLKLGAVALRQRRRLLVLCRYGGLGDIICTFPAAREFIRLHPDREIVYVTRNAFQELLIRSGLPVRSVGMGLHVVPPKWASFFIEQFVMLNYANEDADLDVTSLPLIDDFARSLGYGRLTGIPSLEVDPVRVGAMRAKYLRPDIQRLVLLHIGPTWKVREWPLEHWAELVGKLKELPGVEVLQIVADRNVTVKDASSPIVTGARPVECADHVARLIETIAAADLLIAVESGPVHVAQAVGTNCVALFGPTDPALRVWREDAVAAVHHQIHCSFCHHRRPRLHWESGCPFGIACMQGIPVEQVFNAARSFLGWPADERVTS